MNSYNIPPRDLLLHAQFFHNTAKKLAASLELDSGPFSEFEVAPVIFMYRHAVELHLKALVLGEGSNFLATKPDALSVHKTHSVSWLAQFVVQIITAVKWENEFKCEGVENVADFKAVIEKLSAVDPGSYVFRCPVAPKAKSSVIQFCKKIDALLELLDTTADALAAEWDLRNVALALEIDDGGSGFKQTIQ